VKIEVRSAPIPFSRERVFAALLDPGVLGSLLPGVEKFEETAPDSFDVEVKMGVGAVRGVYTGHVEVIEKQPPTSYVLRGEAKGKQGWARGQARFTLEPEGAATVIVALADAQIGGAIAGVGQRMMEGVAKSMAREFFAALEKELAGRGEQVGQIRFGFRVLWGMVRDFFARLLGRGGGS
jgi:carbon monoxide dehydrogenase subunit G